MNLGLKSLREILQNTTAVKARQVLMTNLCLQQQWHGSVPPATVLAILNGTFVHEMTEVGLFSPFAMLLAKAASANPEDFLSLQLKSAKGKGLDATDIAQTTKSVFYVPTNIHQLAFASVGFVHLVGVIFGTQSVLYWAMHSWTMHMQLNQLAYEEGFSVDAMFGAKILTLIDRRVQNYLKKGYDPATRRMAKTHLSFQVPQNEVVDGKFQYANIPHNILKAYQKQTSGAAAPRRTGSIPVPSDSLPVENPMPLPSLQASEDHLQYLLLNVHNNGPCWCGDGQPCPRYHLAGLCTLGNSCRMANTHRPPANQELSDYTAWYQLCESRLHEHQQSIPGYWTRGGRSGGPAGQKDKVCFEESKTRSRSNSPAGASNDQHS